MRKTTVPLVVALVVSCLLNGLGAPRKKIVIVVHEFPNYVFHLFTLGGIVADPEYAKAYWSTLPEADRLYLESNKKNLEWGNGGLGPFTAAFLFVPGYINPGTRNEVDEYFELLDRALRSDDPGPIRPGISSAAGRS